MVRENIIARSVEALDELATVFGTSWNPIFTRGYDIPAPFHDEAISSWLIRYAIRKRCSTGKILDQFGVTTHKPIYWLDFDPDCLPWDYVGKLTSCSPASLKQLVPELGAPLLSAMLLCLHTDPMRMQPHLRYCMTCLAGDSIPYYRANWRLASTWICKEHGCVMRDYCPLCHTPLFWNYRAHNRIKILNLRMCYHCGEDLCTSEAENVLPHRLRTKIASIQTELTNFFGFFDHRRMLQEPDTEPESHVEQSMNILGISDEKLSQMIRIMDLSPNPESSGPLLGVGIEAKALFGHAAGEICQAIMGQQNLFGTTLWWPGENLLKNALHETWSLQELDQTKQWVLRYSNWKS